MKCLAIAIINGSLPAFQKSDEKNYRKYIIEKTVPLLFPKIYSITL
jgi:hypothetical protein